MSDRDVRISVDLDGEIVERTRSALGDGPESDSAVIERALNAYLLGRLLNDSQAGSTLSEEEANFLAVAAVKAGRRQASAE